MVDFGKNYMMPHFIYCNGDSFYVGEFKKLREIILKKIQNYGIPSSILTMLYMERINLITKEKSREAAEGKLKNEPGWRKYEGSINDDLDSFVNNLQNSEEIGYKDVYSFCTPKLTKEELKLVEQKNREHMETYLDEFDADVDVEEMRKSDSTDKYVHTRCIRTTDYLSLESEQTSSQDSAENLSDDSFDEFNDAFLSEDVLSDVSSDVRSTTELAAGWAAWYCCWRGRMIGPR